MTKIYGHRGSKGNYPENTLLGFQKAIEQGVEGLEIDVHLTKDGEIVVIHDETLSRTTDGEGAIKDCTLAEIQQLSAGNKFQHFAKYESTWNQEKVPTLQEVMQLLDGTDIELNIELKTYIHTYPGIEERLLSEVQRYAPNRKIIYSSFHLPTLFRLKQLDSNADIAWLLQDHVPHLADYMTTFQLEGFHLDKDLMLDADVVMSKQLASYTRVWTVNKEEEINQLLQLGVEAIITDYPEIAVAAKQSIIGVK
ncbi:glycerophosphoryl diester phosphodiesterase [Gracilibacillus halotolerans]|uniref:Glycerophosphoryl diester phosphodiesterase n=1 Tax=Gracilibacillus halotolerans TaxID=74386 RepID=A0A841RR82_9BACI|nr:glycerophosphodiester phosphodiesterase [Gracilibacillus halotolerans]MBB6513444.1 glycerophosphoryl diester phosphodiesterase [Gracilibacillus halotolerans]